MDGLVGAMAGVWVFAIILIIVWILLPFAMFGIKPLLRQILDEQRRLAPTAKTHVRCPDCKELVFMEARKCKHCGCALTPTK